MILSRPLYQRRHTGEQTFYNYRTDPRGDVWIIGSLTKWLCERQQPLSAALRTPTPSTQNDRYKTLLPPRRSPAPNRDLPLVTSTTSSPPGCRQSPVHSVLICVCCKGKRERKREEGQVTVTILQVSSAFIPSAAAIACTLRAYALLCCTSAQPVSHVRPNEWQARKAIVEP